MIIKKNIKMELKKNKRFANFKILKKLGLHKNIKKTECSEIIFNNINILITNEQQIKLKKEKQFKYSITRLQIANTYKGLRHLKGLPVHAQRTKTNSKTIRALYNKKQQNLPELN
jgi:small subunit ribosomal protein S13